MVKVICFSCLATERCLYVLPSRLRCEERSGVQLRPAPPHLEECSICQQAQVCAASWVTEYQPSIISFQEGQWLNVVLKDSQSCFTS